MWQIRWQIYPPWKMAILDCILIDSYSESSHVADQVADLPPLRNGNFRLHTYRFLL